MASRLWAAKHDRLGWVDPLGRCQALCRGSNGRGPDRMMRSCFRVSSMGTDVAGVAAAREGPVGRCVSIADGSLSLSLSLSLLRVEQGKSLISAPLRAPFPTFQQTPAAPFCAVFFVPGWLAGELVRTPPL